MTALRVFCMSTCVCRVGLVHEDAAEMDLVNSVCIRVVRLFEIRRRRMRSCRRMRYCTLGRMRVIVLVQHICAFMHTRTRV